MPEYFIELPWPKLINANHLIGRVDENPDYLHNQNGVENYSQAVNLKKWPTLETDVKHILMELPIDYSIARHVSVQRVLPPGLPWHTDRNRSVAAMALITDNSAWTVFHEEGEKMQRICFEPNKWYMFNGSIPHCVKGLKELRVALCIDLSQTYKDYESAKNELLC